MPGHYIPVSELLDALECNASLPDELAEAGNNIAVLFAVYPCYTNDKNQ